MKILIFHPTGNSNVRAIVKGFFKKGFLYQFHTTIAVFPNTIWFKLSKLKGLGDLQRRSFDTELKPYTKSYPIVELGRLIATRLGLKFLIEPENRFFECR